MADPIPPRLFKYQSYNTQTLDNLKDRTIWFSKPAEFNDPFELSAVLSAERITEADWQALIDAYIRETGMPGGDGLGVYKSDAKPNEAFRNDLTIIAKKRLWSIIKHLYEWGVACFSEKVDDVLMWSHYANGHRGFCLEFDTAHAPFPSAHKVAYSDNVPALSLAELVLDKHKGLGAAPILATKAAHWCYEKEWRVFGELGNTPFTFRAECLTGLYFGCEMPYAHQAIIALMLAGSPTTLHKMSRTGTQFRVESSQVEHSEYSSSKISGRTLHV